MKFKNGWAGPKVAAEAYSALKDRFIPFKIVGSSDGKPGPPIWTYMKLLNGGKNLDPWFQEDSDCVSMGMASALDYLSAAQIVRLGLNQVFKRVYPPYIYGVSRTNADCGAGCLGRGGGSTGAWAAVAVMKYGVLFLDDTDVPEYSGSIARKWGVSGVPQKFYTEASDNLVKSAAKIDSIEELREALINYYPTTLASSRGFEVSERKGCKIYVPRGSCPHQRVFLAWQDDPFPAAFVLNSWGDSTGKSLQGEPLGGAWMPAEDIEWEFRHDSELFAVSGFQGFPAAANKHKFI